MSWSSVSSTSGHVTWIGELDRPLWDAGIMSHKTFSSQFWGVVEEEVSDIWPVVPLIAEL